MHAPECRCRILLRNCLAGHSPSTNKATFNQQHEERKGKERREERVEEEAGGQGSESRPHNLVNDLLYLISPRSHMTWVRYKDRGHCKDGRRGRSSPGNLAQASHWPGGRSQHN